MKPQTLDSCRALRGHRGGVRGAGRRSGPRQRGRPHSALPHARRPAGTQRAQPSRDDQHGYAEQLLALLPLLRAEGATGADVRGPNWRRSTRPKTRPKRVATTWVDSANTSTPVDASRSETHAKCSLPSRHTENHNPQEVER
jgi:hypothetical protein